MVNGSCLLDAHEFQSRLDQTQAAKLQAESDLKRATDLIQQKILSQSEFDDAQSKFRIAAAAEAEAKTMLDYTLIVAPFDGVITRKLAEVGDLAAPGKALLQMENPDTLRLETVNLVGTTDNSGRRSRNFKGRQIKPTLRRRRTCR